MLNQTVNSGIKLTKEEVRDAVLALQAEGKRVPGLMAIRTYIGHGSQGRIKTLRDEVLEELGQAVAMDENNPFAQLTGTLWEQMQTQLNEYKADIKQEADARIAEYIDIAEAEKSEKDNLVNENHRLEGSLSAADKEIARLNKMIVDRDQELIKLTTALKGKEDQLALYIEQFNEYKKMTVTYNKSAVEDKQQQAQELNAAIRRNNELSKELTAREEAYRRELFELESTQSKRWEKFGDLLESLQRSIDATVKTNVKMDKTTAEIKEAMHSQGEIQVNHFTALNNTLLKLNRGVMENVLLLPEIKDQGNISEKFVGIEKQLEAISALLSSPQKE